jgi:ribosomal protein L37E
MSTNPLRREGAYWKPVLDYEHWDAETSSSDGRSSVATATAVAPETAVRHDLCRRCGAEFVVDSPFCRMCGRAKEGVVREKKSVWQALDFYHLRQRLGLTIGAMVCLIVGLTCIGAAIATGFAYTANTFVEWQAIQAWRSEWLVAAGVAFICGILLKNPLK